MNEIIKFINSIDKNLLGILSFFLFFGIGVFGVCISIALAYKTFNDGVYETFLEPFVLFFNGIIDIIFEIFSRIFGFIFGFFHGIYKFFEFFITILYSRFFTAQFCEDFILKVIFAHELFILDSYSTWIWQIVNEVSGRKTTPLFINPKQKTICPGQNAFGSPYSIPIDAFGNTNESFTKYISERLILISFIELNNELGEDFKYIRVCLDSKREEFFKKIVLFVKSVIEKSKDLRYERTE